MAGKDKASGKHKTVGTPSIAGVQKQHIHVGPKGGKFYVNKHGQRVSADSKPASKQAQKHKHKTSGAKRAKQMKRLIGKLKKSIEGESMNKSEELLNELAKSVMNGDATMEDIKKAVKAGYEQLIELTNTELKAQIHDAQDAAETAEVVENTETNTEANAETTEDTVVEAKGPKFANGLFHDFTVGSTFKQGPAGNIVSNIKESKLDYVAEAGKTKNVKITRD